jgi:hypothetical protein
MVDNIIHFPLSQQDELKIEVNFDVEPSEVLHEADSNELESVIVLGFKDGHFYGTSSESDPAQVIMMMEKAKAIILESL